MSQDGGIKKKQPAWQVALAIVGLAAVVGGFMFMPRVGFVLFFLFCFCMAFLKSKSRRFYKMEERLPTSTVRAVALGLAELRGKVVLDVPLVGPISGKPCAGYALIEETSSKDNDGRVTWSESSRASWCNDFKLVDATGQIDVIAEGIALFDGQSSDNAEYLESDRRHGEILLQAGDEIVLIGDAVARDGLTVMACGTQKNAVFAVQRGADVDLRRDMAPLIRAGGFYAAFAGAIAAGILWLTPLQLAQLHLPTAENYAQMASLGPVYQFLAWIARNDGVPLPFMAAFGLMGVLMVLLIATRLFLPLGMRSAVQGVLWGWMAVGVIVGGPVTLLLVLSDIDPIKVTLIWGMILLLSLAFALFQQRALRAAARSIIKHAPSTDGSGSSDSDDGSDSDSGSSSDDADLAATGKKPRAAHTKT